MHRNAHTDPGARVVSSLGRRRPRRSVRAKHVASRSGPTEVRTLRGRKQTGVAANGQVEVRVVQRHVGGDGRPDVLSVPVRLAGRRPRAGAAH